MNTFLGSRSTLYETDVDYMDSLKRRGKSKEENSIHRGSGHQKGDSYGLL